MRHPCIQCCPHHIAERSILLSNLSEIVGSNVSVLPEAHLLHIILFSSKGWSKFMGIRDRAEGQRGHDFFWLVKQRGHDFFPPVKQRGQDLFWPVKQRGHDFFIHSKQRGQDICL